MPQPVPPVLVVPCGPAPGTFGHLLVDALTRRPVAGVGILEFGRRGGSVAAHLGHCNTLYVVGETWAPAALPGRLIDADWRDPDRPLLKDENERLPDGSTVAENVQTAQQADGGPAVVRVLAVTTGPAQAGGKAASLIRARAADAGNIVARRAALLQDAAREACDA